MLGGKILNIMMDKTVWLYLIMDNYYLNSYLLSRVQTKKEAVKLASEVTNELVHINQMMAEQVKQSEQNMQHLGMMSVRVTFQRPYLL